MLYAYLALAGLQMYSGYQMGNAVIQAGQLQAQIGSMNAQYAELDAFNALKSGQANQARYYAAEKQTIASGEAAEAGSGVSVGYGTAGSVAAANKIAGMSNSLQLQRQAQNTAAGYEEQAVNLQLGGQMASLNADLSGISEQYSSILQGAGTAVQGYAYSQSSGQGFTGKTGSSSTPTWSQPVNMQISSQGDGFGSSSTFGAGFTPDIYGNDGNIPGWYPGMNAGSSFYGYGPASEYSMPYGTNYGGPGYVPGGVDAYSFSSETAG